jgi:TonB-dependent starch-binding outer membrane protein SusC
MTAYFPSFSNQEDWESQGKEIVIHDAIVQSPFVGLDQATRDFGFPVWLRQAYPNPLERLKYTTDRTNRAKFTSLVWGQYDLMPGLSFKSHFGYNYQGDNFEFFQPGNITQLDSRQKRLVIFLARQP